MFIMENGVKSGIDKEILICSKCVFVSKERENGDVKEKEKRHEIICSPATVIMCPLRILNKNNSKMTRHLSKENSFTIYFPKVCILFYNIAF